MANNMLKRLYLLQGGKCFYCQQELAYHTATIEHIIPRSKGGTNTSENLCVCCKAINQRFSNNSPKFKMEVLLANSPDKLCPENY